MDNYTIKETGNYLQFKDLFEKSGLEFNTDETGEKPDGFVTAYALYDAEGQMKAAVSITERKGYYIVNDIAVEARCRGKGYGEKLLRKALELIKSKKTDSVFITAKAPLFFEKYGFYYLDDEEVPDIFGCLKCEQYGKNCMPKFMKYDY